MQEKDLVTIIIPIYNVEKYVEKCLDSVIKQSYKNIEIILINDGSTDLSGKICEKYAKIDKRIKYIDKKNEGVSKTRNLGIKMATGSFVIFVDADDYISEKCVETLYQQIIYNNADISICGNVDLYEKKYKKSNRLTCKKIMSSREALKELLDEKYFTSVIWAKIYRRKIINNIFFDNNLEIAEDLDFLYRTINAANTVSIDTNNVVYYYRIRENSATTDMYSESWKKEIKLCENIIKDIEKKDNNRLKIYAIKRYIRINCTCMIKILIYSPTDKKEYNMLKKNIKKYFWIFMTNNKIEIKKKIKLVLVMYFKNILKYISLD